MPPLPKKPDHIREINVNKNYLCYPINDLSIVDWEFTKNNINYDYYITQCEDIINKIKQKQ